MQKSTGHVVEGTTQSDIRSTFLHADKAAAVVHGIGVDMQLAAATAQKNAGAVVKIAGQQDICLAISNLDAATAVFQHAGIKRKFVADAKVADRIIENADIDQANAADCFNQAAANICRSVTEKSN